MKYFLLSVLFAAKLCALGQSTDIPLNSRAYPIYSEWDVKSKKNFFTAVKPISRSNISQLSIHVTRDSIEGLSAPERHDLYYLLSETREYHGSLFNPNRGLFGRFYKYDPDFISRNEDDFDLHLNPIIVFGGGRESNGSDILYENYRGLEIRGTIDNKISFYTMLTENQARYPTYVRNVTDSTLNIPYEGFWKQYNETGVDFLRAQAYIDFNISKHINAQFGFGKHFIGEGRRSLILSDFGNNYPYLRIKTQIGRFQYTNIFAQLIAQTTGGSYGIDGIGSFPKKYLALHRLEMNVTDNLNIGLFESIIYGRPDSLSNSGIRAAYLNPLIFYRALEQQDGSADNALLGLDFKWNIFQKFSLYGQLVIDELIVSKAFSGDGYWENKQAFQLGGKYFGAFGLRGLTLQTEWNQVRPFTYAHQDIYTSYSHYNTALAHPLGANFREILFAGTYRITPKMTLRGTLLLSQYGNDNSSFSSGRDILKPYNSRDQTINVGIDLLQGDKTDLLLFQSNLSYEWFHNLHTDLNFIYRQEEAASSFNTVQSKIISFTLRYNFGLRDYLF